MLTRLLAALLFVSLTFAATAQKGKLRSGIIALDGGDYIRGVTLLEEGFANLTEGEAPQELIAKSYLYLAQGYVLIYQALNDEVQMKLNASLPAYADKKPEIATKVHTYLQKTKENDPQNNLEKPYNENAEQAWRILFTESLVLRENKDYVKSNEFLLAAEQYIQPPWFNIYLLKAYNSLSVADTFSSVDAFRQTVTTFWADTAEVRKAGADGIKQVYSNLNVILGQHNPSSEAIYKYFVKDNPSQSAGFLKHLAAAGYQADTALSFGAAAESNPGLPALLTSAYRGYADELSFELAKEAYNKYPADKLLIRQYASILQKPAYREQGLAFFEAQVESDPGNVTFLTAYAEMLAEFDVAKAKQYYQKALKVKPDDLYANYNLAVILNNEAAALQREYNELEKAPPTNDNNLKLAELQKDIRKKIEETKIYALAAHEADPTQCAPLQLLIAVFGYLNDEAKVNEFIEKRNTNGC